MVSPTAMTAHCVPITCKSWGHPLRAQRSYLSSVFDSAFSSSEFGTNVAKKHDGKCVEEVTQVSETWRKIRARAAADCITCTNAGLLSWCSLGGDHSSCCPFFCGWTSISCALSARSQEKKEERTGEEWVRYHRWYKALEEEMCFPQQSIIAAAVCFGNMAICRGPRVPDAFWMLAFC